MNYGTHACRNSHVVSGAENALSPREYGQVVVCRVARLGPFLAPASQRQNKMRK